MTKSDILNIPAGREMDALIAELIFGLEVEWTTAYDGKAHPFCRALQTRYDESGWIDDYSTDISAAWKVMDLMLSHPDMPDCSIRFDAYGRHWSVWFSFGDGNRRHAIADTVELAICRAALLAKLQPTT